MSPLEQRLSKLEKSLQLYRVIFGSATLLIVAFLLMSSGKKTYAPDVIQAKKFELVNDNGNVIGSFYQDKGDGVLTTYSPSGTKMVSLIAVDGGGGGINTFDESGNLVFKVTKTEGGGGFLGLYNKENNEMVQLGATTSDAGYVQINDQNGTKLDYLARTADGGGYLSLSNGDVEKIILSTTGAGGRLNIYNGDGQRVMYGGAEDDQTGNMSVYDRTGNYINGFGK